MASRPEPRDEDHRAGPATAPDAPGRHYGPPPPPGTLQDPAVLIDWFDGPPPEVAADGAGNPYWVLSNFAPTPFQAAVGGFPMTGFATAEAAFQAAKATTQEGFEQVAGLQDPAAAKAAGRRVSPLRPDWNDVKVGVMREVVAAKFDPRHQPETCALLLSTGEARLLEGTLWGDEVWGFDLGTGRGQNLLGLLLQVRRAELRLGLVPRDT